MNESIPPVFRSALDEPVPPAPVDAEPHRDDDDGPCDCVSAPLIVWGHGGVSTTGFGTLLVGWFFVASGAALWTFASTFTVSLLSAALVVGVLVLLGEAVGRLWRWLHK